MTIVTMVRSSKTMMTTIRDEKITTIVTVFSSRDAADDNEDNDWK